MKSKNLILSVLASLFIAPAAGAESDIKLIVDDKIIDTAPISVNDRTLVPLRALMESTGAEVEWDDVTMGIDIKRNDNKIHLQINNPVMNTADKDIELDAAPVLYNNTTTYVPLRAICEEFDFSVDWDEGTQTILINAPGGCPYVDTYGGITFSQYLEISNMTADDFSKETGIDTAGLESTPFINVVNSLPAAYVLSNTDEAEKILEIEGGISPNDKIGDVLGKATLRGYLSYVSSVEYSDEMFASFKQYYNLGDEYSPDTRFRYVRTIINLHDIKTAGTGLPSEEELANYEAMLPSLCENKKYFTITLEDGSQMHGEIYPDLAKNTVENFEKLCKEGFYNGLIFHRVIDGFMIQGGGYDKDMNPKATSSIIGEFYENGIINPLKHERGVISMARANDPNSASGQFFIMVEAAPHLDGHYAAFGRITDGFDVIDKIAGTETSDNSLGMSDVPVSDIVIKSITIDEK